MNLDLVLGLSCCNQSSITTDKAKGLIAYPASGVLVLFQPKLNFQVAYLRVQKNAISCACFSPDGQYIVTGELGYRPVLRVWSVHDGVELASMPGHEFGIKAVLWAPHGSYIVSVGEEYDNEVNVWSWPGRHRKATNKIKDCIHAVAFSECGQYFVTVGVRHVKFWYPNQTLATEDACFKVPKVVPLYGRPATLGVFKNNIFLDVCCGNSVCDKFIYVISKAGNVIILNSSRRDVCCQKNLPNDKVTCVYVLRQIIFLGTESGLIHLMSALSLQHLATLPVPAHFHNKLALNRAVFTMVFNPSTRVLTAVYMNTSLCIWDLGDGLNIKQTFRAVYPHACITDLHVVPSGVDNDVFRDTLVTVSHNFHVHLWSITTSDTVTFEKLNILAAEAESPVVGNVDSTYQKPTVKVMEKDWRGSWGNSTQNNNPEDGAEEQDCKELTGASSIEPQTNVLTKPTYELNENEIVENPIIDQQEDQDSPVGTKIKQRCIETSNKGDGLVIYSTKPNITTKVLLCEESPKKVNIIDTKGENPIVGEGDSTSKKAIAKKMEKDWCQNYKPEEVYYDIDCNEVTNITDIEQQTVSPTNSCYDQIMNELAVNQHNDQKNKDPEMDNSVKNPCNETDSEHDNNVTNPTEPNNITTVLICKGHPECYPDFHHIVTGNTVGNISAHDAATFQHHVTFMSHNRDVTSLAFYADSHGRMTLLSGGRDRLIHVMDARSSYRLVRTLDIHSSSINALKTVVYMDEAYLISCSADRSLKMCIAHNSQEDGRRDVSLFQLSKAQMGVSSPNDMAVFPAGGELAAAYQDGYVRVFGLMSLQGRRVFKGCKGNECQVTRITLCRHGVLLITAASDRTINVINFKTGTILASMAGHYKMVTGLSFSSSGEYVISAAMDGCIFFWRMSQRLKDFQLEHSNVVDHRSPPVPRNNKSFNGFYLLDKNLSVEKISIGPEENYDIITLEKTKEPKGKKRSKRLI